MTTSILCILYTAFVVRTYVNSKKDDDKYAGATEMGNYRDPYV